MNNKRGFADRHFPAPIHKRSRYLDEDQAQHHRRNYQQRIHHRPHSHYPSDQSSYDPLHCVQHLEQLSLSHDNPPHLKSQVPQAESTIPPIVEDLSRLPSNNQSHSHPHPVNQNSKFKDANFLASHPESLPSTQNHQSLSLSSSQYQSHWTQVVKKGMQNNATWNQPSFNRNPWIRVLPQSQSTSNNSEIFVHDASRSIANLPKRASIVSPNAFAALSSHSMNEASSSVYLVPSHAGPTQTNSISKASKRNPRKSKKKRNKQVPVIIDDDKQIDIVLDTNILLSYQHFLRAAIPLLSSTCRILVPQAVLRELDMQKNRQQLVEVYEAGRCSSENTMASLARQATKWLLSITKSNFSNVLIQKIEEEPEEMKRRMDADTRILSYAHKLFLQAKAENSGAVIALLSNDNILRLRAQSEGICCLAMSDCHHSPRQMMSHLRNFVPHPSISRPPVYTGSSSLSSLPPVCAPPTEKPQLTQKTNEPSVKSWVPSEKDAQFTFTSLLPNINKPDESAAPSGPDQELIRLKSHIQQPRPCMGCKSDIQSTLQVSPDKIHHYCPMCCEVICRGCMQITGCDWDCPGPFHGKVCATMKCCAEGRAAILLELLGQLDSYSLTSYYKLSFKNGPKITHLYDDKALTQYIQATIVLLMTSDAEDERLGFLESILISSTLLDILSQTLLSSPFMKWHSRSELYMSAINLIKTIFQSLTRPWMIINSEYIKSSTTGILSVNPGHQKIVWHRVIETSNQSNATSAKIEKLRESFPSLMVDVKNVLRNRSESSSTVTQELVDNAVHVPLCYILENLFKSSIEMKKNQSDPVIISDDIHITDSSPLGLMQLIEALLDLKDIYESNIILQASDSNIKSKPGGHQGKSVNSANDQECDDCEEESNDDNTKGRVDVNHETKLSLESQIGLDVEVVRGDVEVVRDDVEVVEDDVEVVIVKTQQTASHTLVEPQVDGKGNGVRFKGTADDESKRTNGAGEKESKPTCSVGKFFDQVDTLTISSDESESDDSTIEVIHLN